LAQGDSGCLPHFQEALTLNQRIGDRSGEAQHAGSLGNAYLMVPRLRDLGRAEHWFNHSLSLHPGSDRLGRAKGLDSLGTIALNRFDDARTVGEAEPVLLEHLNAALSRYQQALDLTVADDHETRGIIENQLGNVYTRAGDTRQSLRHFQQAIKHDEARGDIYGAAENRHSIAILLANDGRVNDALHYARAALDNYQQAGPGAASEAAAAERLIALLEQHNR
jgi:tetratricopeptide (TPR) repeat protein